jgi:predicted nucleotidyltransferase
MVTASQQKLIDEIGKLLGEEGRVEAAWLAGSLGRGQGDSFSDVDLLVLVEDGTLIEVSSTFVARLSTVVRPVHVNKLFGGRVLNVVTADWQRFDLSFIQREDLPRHNGALFRPLFNRSGQTPPVEPEMPYRPAPKQLLKLVQEFIRVLGLAVVVVGRKEYVMALSGIEHLRRMTFDLMTEENRVAPGKRGGALHRNSLLDAEQRAQLESLPPLVAQRASVIEGHRALAELFLPTARRLAAEIAMVWPSDFEEATRRYLEANLQVRL